MDAVHQAQEPLDIGVCNTHNRVFECYCTICHVLICPSCLMFDSHKGHSVSTIQQGARQIRNQINNAAKEGSLKFQKTQSVLLDIRHAKLTLEQNAQAIIQKSQKYYDELISALKLRKHKFLQQLKGYFNQQIQSIDKNQQQWLRKQQISQKILKLQTSKDDLKLMEQAGAIIQGLGALSKPVQYKQIHLLQSIESDIGLGKQKYQFKELQDGLKEYLKKGRQITNRIRC